MSNICETCNKVLGSKKNLVRHRQLHLEGNHTCPTCNKSFTRRDNLQIHMNNVHGDSEKPNNTVGSAATSDASESAIEVNDTRPSLFDHFDNCSLSSEEIEDDFKCDKCDRSFTLKRNLTRHLSTHKKIKHKCVKCNKSSTRRDSMKRHMHSKHKDTTPKSILVKHNRQPANIHKSFKIRSVRKLLAKKGVLHTPTSSTVLHTPTIYGVSYSPSQYSFNGYGRSINKRSIL